MPFINVEVNVKLSEQNKNTLKSQLGEAITILPGKSESWLMIGIKDECTLYFKGDNSSKLAFIEVKSLGKCQKSVYDKFTEKISSIFNEVLDICLDNIYIKYEETEYWGWNGSNL